MVLDPLCLLVNQENVPFHQSCQYSGLDLEPDAPGGGFVGCVLPAGVLATVTGVLAPVVWCSGSCCRCSGSCCWCSGSCCWCCSCGTFTVDEPTMVACCCGTAEAVVPVNEAGVVDAAVLLID